MKRNSLSLLFLLPLCASCSPKQYALDDYVSEFPANGSVKILQLADMHWSWQSDLKRESEYIDALISLTGADLAVLTGDQVLGASKQTYLTLFDALDASSLKGYALAWGNHDEQGLYDPDFPTKEALSREKCLNKDLPGDAVYGDSNYVIDLVGEDGKPWYELFVLDSNKLNPEGFSMGYDVIHEDQIDWYARMVDRAKQENGETVPSLAFFHIPLWQWEYAYRLSKQADPLAYSLDPAFPGGIRAYSGEMHEESWEVPGLGETRVYCGYRDSGFFKLAEELGSTKAMFVGHDHKNDFAAEYYLDESKADDPIALCYGLKSGDELTYERGHIGGNLITVSEGGSLSLQRAFLDYHDDGYQMEDLRLEAMFNE